VKIYLTAQGRQIYGWARRRRARKGRDREKNGWAVESRGGEAVLPVGLVNGHSRVVGVATASTGVRYGDSWLVVHRQLRATAGAAQAEVLCVQVLGSQIGRVKHGYNDEENGKIGFYGKDANGDGDDKGNARQAANCADDE
jgi:hypothetical protein